MLKGELRRTIIRYYLCIFCETAVIYSGIRCVFFHSGVMQTSLTRWFRLLFYLSHSSISAHIFRDIDKAYLSVIMYTYIHTMWGNPNIELWPVYWFLGMRYLCQWIQANRSQCGRRAEERWKSQENLWSHYPEVSEVFLTLYLPSENHDCDILLGNK